MSQQEQQIEKIVPQEFGSYLTCDYIGKDKMPLQNGYQAEINFYSIRGEYPTFYQLLESLQQELFEEKKNFYFNINDFIPTTIFYTIPYYRKGMSGCEDIKINFSGKNQLERKEIFVHKTCNDKVLELPTNNLLEIMVILYVLTHETELNGLYRITKNDFLNYFRNYGIKEEIEEIVWPEDK